MKRMPVLEIVTVTIGVILQVDPVAGNSQEPKQADSVSMAWYTPAELLTALAQRDGIHWALPETLSGRALVGNAATTDVLLDDACRQWGLAWTRSNGVIVVHRAEGERLKN